jgi:uncharacterized protein (DUF2225 family)
MNKQIKCPVCGEWLFETDERLLGQIRIKSRKCKKLIFCEFSNGGIRFQVEPNPHKRG